MQLIELLILKCYCTLLLQLPVISVVIDPIVLECQQNYTINHIYLGKAYPSDLPPFVCLLLFFLHLIYLCLDSTPVSHKLHVFIFCAVSYLKLIQMLQLGKLLVIVQILELLCLNRYYIISLTLIPKKKIEIKFLRNNCFFSVADTKSSIGHSQGTSCKVPS